MLLEEHSLLGPVAYPPAMPLPLLINSVTGVVVMYVLDLPVQRRASSALFASQLLRQPHHRLYNLSAHAGVPCCFGAHLTLTGFLIRRQLGLRTLDRADVVPAW